MKPYIIGCIFARGGSKGVPRKNIRPLAGKPLIAYAIETGLASKWIDRVVVSTDDPEIAEVARKHGAEVPFVRPPELARDDSPEWLAWQHAIRQLSQGQTERLDVFAVLPVTAPLRSVCDLDACIELCLDSEADVVVTVTEAERNPYFNMVRYNPEGFLDLVIKPVKPVVRRQDAPQVFDMTTVAYAVRPEFVLRASSMWEGRLKAVVVPKERAVDIDTGLDFQWAEFLLAQQPVRIQS